MERRTVIADAAIDVIADSGLRALTHRGIDSALDFPAGSTSYYFRTKSDLMSAVIDRIADSSRVSFDGVSAQLGREPVEVTVRYLEHLLVERRNQLRARHSLLIDPSIDTEARARLDGCLFSVDGAVELFGDRAVGQGYVALCEGLVLASLGRGSGHVEVRAPIVTYLTGAGKV
ncbi:hypothetical protein [Rhodococcus sovatensis]|uniref:HTH tetR-type domain-containing protein n=1 Tax=Rhodococcus sovatensis TaxID=1805840 RepID=A0ABZ2PG83_9NOCA